MSTTTTAAPGSVPEPGPLASSLPGRTNSPTDVATFTTTSAEAPAVTTPLSIAPDCFSMWASYHAPSVGPLTTLSDTAIFMLLPQRLIGPSCYSSILDARTLSPAVCPSKWIYHSVRAQGGYTTTASCCASGYSIWNSAEENSMEIPHDSRFCYKAFQDKNVSAIITDGFYGPIARTKYSGDGFFAHAPLVIKWKANDLGSLSPSPPPGYTNSVIKTWTPGSIPTYVSIESSEGRDGIGGTSNGRGGSSDYDFDYDFDDDGGGGGRPPTDLAIKIGVPLICGVIFIIIVVFQLRSRSKRKRKQCQQQYYDEHGLSTPTLNQGSGPTSGLEPFDRIEEPRQAHVRDDDPPPPYAEVAGRA